MGWLLNKLRKLLHGTVIKRIWKKILLICIYASTVVAAYHYLPFFGQIQLKLNILEILGVVTGLLLVFRTQIGYDRYWEGRNLWSKMGSALGTLARLIWISAKAQDSKDVIEKKTILNLLSAFPLATKHYLRDEYAQEFQEVREYLSVFPEVLYQRPTTVGAATCQGTMGFANGTGKVKHEEPIPSFVAPSNVPSIIVYYLGAYLDKLVDRKMADVNCMRILQDNVTELEDILSGLEKILRTPMPLAYSLHLGHCLHIYVMAIPLQLVPLLSWYVIPVTGIACFAIMGILDIGAEIENPFGSDDNDLPLDDFCEGIIKEIRLIQSLSLQKTEDWIINSQNYPCGTSLGVNALEMSKSMTVNQAYDICRQEALQDRWHKNNVTKSTSTLILVKGIREGVTG